MHRTHLRRDILWRVRGLIVYCRNAPLLDQGEILRHFIAQGFPELLLVVTFITLPFKVLTVDFVFDAQIIFRFL